MMMSAVQDKVKFGLVGLGGYAWFVAQKLAARQDAVDFSVACDISAAVRDMRADQLAQWKVRSLESFDRLLEEPIEAVWLPVPISLHLPFMLQALARGKAVLCEKPVAATVQEVDEMIAAGDRAKLPVLIGYQNLCDPAILELKQRVLAGDIGTLTGVRTMACWPRTQSYYQRNNWAGKLKVNGQWVLDSPASNALSHYMQLGMFLAGPTEQATAQAANVTAELYRANPIENFDTCSLRVRLDTAAELMVWFTHACQRTIEPTIQLIGTKGRATVYPEKRIEIESPAGRTTLPLSKTPHDNLIDTFRRHLRGEPARTALPTLEVARAPVVVCNAASAAAVVQTIAPESTLVNKTDVLRFVPGIEEVFEHCLATGQMVHESGLVHWSSAAGSITTTDYRTFAGVAGA